MKKKGDETMDLREFLFRNNLSGAQFGRILNYDSQYINCIVRGVRKPGKKLIKLIERATHGQVKETDLLAPFHRKNQKSQNDYHSDYHLECLFPYREECQKQYSQEKKQENTHYNL